MGQVVKGPPSSLLALEMVGWVPWESTGTGGFGIPPCGKEGQAQGSRHWRVLERLSSLY